MYDYRNYIIVESDKNNNILDMRLESNLKKKYDNITFLYKSLKDGSKIGVNIKKIEDGYETLLQVPLGVCIGKVRNSFRKNFNLWIKEQNLLP